DTDMVNLFYAEAVDVVNYLIREFGVERFAFFCRNLRDKKDFAAALSSSYPFGDIQQLDKAWQRFLKE
ncbi:MAG: hypothetical protein NC908_02675, partial [Candidatus Omnitrophica bacterium]|nr:hypothetical protein [Candidatus Omnitrophota bacterium]